jgi:hypothetical protein
MKSRFVKILALTAPISVALVANSAFRENAL